MTTVPAIHLAIIQPEGYVHSLGFLDQARYFRHMFRRLGATVTLAKNRLREDAVNFVFGAHLGFPADWQARHACVFVNLEQLGQGGAQVNPAYLELLRRSAVVDYDAANVPAYAQDADDVPLFSFGYGAYLDEPALPLEQRPIDLLFFGSLNDRRRAFIARVEAAGFNVALFDAPVYGAERDGFIRSAKAVLNCHYYESNRFEQARAFHCLSLGTPLISEYTPTTDPAPAFVDSVLWLPGQVETWFAQHFCTPGFYDEARQRLAAFRTPDAAHDPLAQFADLLDFAVGFQQGHAHVQPRSMWTPRFANIDPATPYKPGWLNIAARPDAQPDVVLDPSAPLALPRELPTQGGGMVRLEAGALEMVYAGALPDHVADPAVALGNVLELLQVGGACVLDLPVPGRAVDWGDFTDGFWRAGWFEHRFEMADPQWLDESRDPVAREQATRVRLVLRKIVTTPRERTLARTLRADFGVLADDATTAAQAPRAPGAAPTDSRAELAVSAPAVRPHPAGLPASLVALLLD